MTIIIKMRKDEPIFNRIDPTEEEQKKAWQIHETLLELIPQIEKDLEKEVSRKESPQKRKKRIKNKSIFKLGKKLRKSINEELCVPEEEIDWIFKAIREIYSTGDVFLKRGNKRDDFRYIFEAARLPYDFFEKITWDGWRRLMDSPNIRRDKRFSLWLERKYGKNEQVKKGFVRKFVKELNRLLKNKDTSVFTDDEIFEIYEKAWDQTLLD